MATILDRLKAVDANRLSLDDIVELSAETRALAAEYDRLGVEVPEIVTSKLKSFSREINSRQAEALEKALREKKARLNALKTPEQRRKELEAEIAELEAKTAVTV